MIEKQSITDQDIINTLKANYGINVIKLTFLPLGADSDASVYKAETDTPRSYFIKLKRGHQDNICIKTLALLQEADIPVIPPVKNLHGQATQLIEEFTLIVYPFVQGQDGFTRPLSKEQWFKLGKALKEVHELKVPSSIETQIRCEIYSSKWRDLLRSFYMHFEAKSMPDPIALKLLNFIKENKQIIFRIVDRAEELAQKICHYTQNFVLCHSDIHGGNVLIDDHEKFYIVDWDDPIMAPKERDLMFIGGGVANVWNKADEEEFFYNGYGKTNINRTILAYYRYERIVEDIACYVQALLLTQGNPDRQTMFNHFIAMFEPNGVVEIALKTDEA